jgi:2-polyprenyl-3-methyl-5-hydroxy-6-metoxy-1,4-benzoquinol methylase
LNPWWADFFDRDYLNLIGQLFTEEVSQAQAAAIWGMLDLEAGCRVLDAPCGWGRIARPLAELGACVLGVDQSAVMIEEAQGRRGAAPAGQLRYLQHDLRRPLEEGGFDVACNVFTSFGYGTVEDDAAMFRTLWQALRPGGRLLVETNHRDLMCAYVARGSQLAQRLADGTLFLDEAEFDPIAGVVRLHWYWSGPLGNGEKHAVWRCYTPTQMVEMLEAAGFRFAGAYRGLSSTLYRADAPDAGGRLALVAVREG